VIHWVPIQQISLVLLQKCGPTGCPTPSEMCKKAALQSTGLDQSHKERKGGKERDIPWCLCLLLFQMELMVV